MYNHKMNDHKLRQSKDSTLRAEKRSTRRKRSSSPVMTVIISSEQYAALERASKNQSGIILNVVSASNLKKRKSEPYTGSLILTLA